MAFLINRNPSARLRCLHSIIKLIYKNYSTTKSFTLSNLKFDPAQSNIYSFCDILLQNSNLEIKYCRYKGPLDQSKCSLTNSVNLDSTKSKEVSNTVNSLHGLGFVTRSQSGEILLTDLGKLFASTKFNSPQMLKVIRQGVLNYGPFVGIIGQLYLKNKGFFDSQELEVGYPSTNEKVKYNNHAITISSGSQSDSNTRTRSCLLAWGISAGFFAPTHLANINPNNAHIETEDYVLQDSRNSRKFRIIKLPEIFDSAFITNRTLDYKNLTKNEKALRENNQEEIREATMQASYKINNRRFLILYLINKSFLQNKTIKLKDIVSALMGRKDLYVINEDETTRIVEIELKICNSAGLIFEKEMDSIKPLNGINQTELQLGLPIEVMEDIDERFCFE